MAVRHVKSFELMNISDSDSSDDEFCDARSTAGQSDSTFFSARGHGSSAAPSNDTASVVGTYAAAHDPMLDDPDMFQACVDAISSALSMHGPPDIAAEDEPELKRNRHDEVGHPSVM